MYLKLGPLEVGTNPQLKSSGTVPLSSGQIRDSWDDPLLKAINGYVPTKYNLKLYDVIREALPIIDVAIIKLVRLIGDFEFETYGNMALKRKLEQFREKVKVNDFATGMDDYIYQCAESAFGYGFAVSELVPNRILTDVERLKIGDSKTFLFKKINGLLSLVQKIESGFKEVPMRDNIFYLAFDTRNGHPQGISMVHQMVYTSQIMLRIEKAIENLYWRLGDPTFVALISGGKQTTPDQIKKAVGDIIEQFSAAMTARRSGQIKDIFGGAPHGGNVSITSLGSDFKWPEADKHTKLLLEQIIAKTDLLPFMLGLSWSTTERMSKDQNDMIVSATQSRRRQIKPHIKEIIDTFLILTGDAGAKWDLVWKPVNLLDVMESSRARYFEAFAMEKETQNYLSLIENGWISEEEVQERVRSDFRYRKDMQRVTGGTGKVEAQQYLQFKRNQYGRQAALNAVIFDELMKEMNIDFSN